MSLIAMGNATTARPYDPFWAQPTPPQMPIVRLAAESPVENPTIGAPLGRIANIIGSLPDALSTFILAVFLDLPQPEPRLAPHLKEMVREIRRLTGWSERALAQRVGTSHPTIAAAESGSSGALVRSPNVYARIGALHQLVVRIAPLVKGGPLDVDRALTTAHVDTGATALEYLTDGDVPG